MSKEKKDFITIVIGKLLQIVFMLSIIRVSTNLLDPEGMGNIYMIMTFSSFFMLIFLNSIGEYIKRNLHEWKEKGILSDSISYFILYAVIIAFFSTFLMLIYIILFGMPVDLPLEVFIFLLFFYLLFTFLNVFLISLLNFLSHKVEFVGLTLLTAIGILLFGYLSVSYFGATADYWLYGLVGSNALFTLFTYNLLRVKIGKESTQWYSKLISFNYRSLSSLSSFAIPLAFAAIFMWLQQNGYRIIIEKNIGLSFLGFLGIGLVVASQISSVFESILLQYFYPIYYQEISNTTKENRTKAINKFINRVLPIYLILTIFITFVAKYMVEILVDEKFYEAYYFTVFGIWIEFFRMTGNLFGNIGQSEMKTKKLLIPYASGSSMAIILIYFASLSDNYPFYIPMALLIGSFFTMISMYIEMKKLLTFTIDYKLLFMTLILAIPFVSVYWISIEKSFFYSLLIVMGYGFYFLGMVYIIHLKSINRLRMVKKRVYVEFSK